MAGAGTAVRTGPGDDQVWSLLQLLPEDDVVELRFPIRDRDHRSALAALGVDDLLEAEIRQVAFVDTPDLRLLRHGVVVRAQRTQQRRADVVLELDHLQPWDAVLDVRRLPELDLELDATPTGFRFSCLLDAEVPDRRLRTLLSGRVAAAEVLSSRQRAVLEQATHRDVPLDQLTVLGRIHVLNRTFMPPRYAHRLVAELWFLPDGSRLLDLTARCSLSGARRRAIETRRFLAARHVEVDAPLQATAGSALAALAARSHLPPPVTRATGSTTG